MVPERESSANAEGVPASEASLDREVEILRRSAVMAPPGSRLPVLRELLLRIIARSAC